jgi:endonuclease YncB( thermonuclease family)
MRQYPIARVIRVVDGDTIKLALDLDFGIEFTCTVRLKDVRCPELSTGEPGQAAKLFTEQWLADNTKSLKFQVQDKDLYSRYVGTITSGTKSLNAAIKAKQ